MNEVPQSQALAYLTFLTGPLTGITFPVTRSVTTLGRDGNNDIVIADPKVSRHHARLTWSNASWHIEKLSQTSSISVNQRDIEQAILDHNSSVNLGEDSSFRFLLTLEQNVPLEADAPHRQTEHVVASINEPVATVERADEEIKKQVFPALSLPHPSPGLSRQGKQFAGTEVASLATLGIPSIEVTDNTTGARKEYALAQGVLSIGRDASNDIVISEPSVSDFHLQITRQDGQWVLLHPHPLRRETQNGLLYAGRKIQGNEFFSKPLMPGDTFRIGDEHGTLVSLTYNDGGSVQELAPRMQVIQLPTLEVTLGRLHDNAIVLDHPQVSAHHAQLIQEENSYRLIDLNSTNHTYVNGLQVSEQLLQGGDEIRIGPFKLIYADFQLTLYDERGGIRIDALNLKQIGTNQTVLLNDISLSIPQCSFVALVGASGAGKSTLLDALSGLRPAKQGAIFYNGQNYYQHHAAFSTQIGYVPQDEIIHRDLTVERVLYYAAKLRLPKDFTSAQVEERIDEVLDDVEMQHRRALLVRQLSGGQRKRISIALELLAKPSIFFLDEPTSGLDPGLDRKMMVLLRKLADKGHTIVLVTHATNNINVCDYVCFLAPGGNLAYFGPPEEARAYFEQPDFAEIYSALEPGDGNRAIPLAAAEQFRQSQTYQRYIDEPLDRRPKESRQLLHQKQRLGKAARRGTSWRQFVLLFTRYLELLKNDRGNLAILLLQAPIIGLLLLVLIKEVGPGGFNPNNVVLCPSTAAIVAPAGFPDVPTPVNPVVSRSCQRVENFLSSNPTGKVYASRRGGMLAALQDFLVPGLDYAPTILFIMAFSAIMFGCINAAREFVKEAPIYRRERAVNLGILPYMFSKIAVLGLLCLAQSLILVVCVAIFDPFRHSVFLPPFLEVYITTALTSLAGLMIGLTVSALVSNNDRAMSFVPLILIPQVIFSGTIFPLTSWFLQYAGMLFPIRWAMAALGSSVGLHSDKLNGDKLLGDIYTYHSTLLSTYSQEEATHYLVLMWLALGITIVVFGVATGYFLKRKDTRV